MITIRVLFNFSFTHYIYTYINSSLKRLIYLWSHWDHYFFAREANIVSTELLSDSEEQFVPFARYRVVRCAFVVSDSFYQTTFFQVERDNGKRVVNLINLHETIRVVS